MKMKKVLATVLAGAMVLSSVTVFAEDPASDAVVTADNDGGAGESATTNTASTLDIPASMPWYEASAGWEPLSGDFNVTYTFKIDLVGSYNWNNFMIRVKSGEDDFLNIRADHYAFTSGTNFGDKNSIDHGIAEWSDAGPEDWAEWLALCMGSDVTVNLVRTGDTLDYSVKFSFGNEMKATFSTLDMADDIQVTLGGENSSFSNIKFVNNTNSSGDTEQPGTSEDTEKPDDSEEPSETPDDSEEPSETPDDSEEPSETPDDSEEPSETPDDSEQPSTPVETLTGTAWWTGMQASSDVVLSGDGTWTYTIDAKELIDGNGAFSVEVYGDGKYITTGSDKNAWYAEGAEGDAITGIAETLSSDLVEGNTYTVTITRTGGDFTFVYEDATTGSEYARLEAKNTNLPTDVNAHVMAQVGTYDVSLAGNVTTPTTPEQPGETVQPTLKLSKSKVTLYTGKASKTATITAEVTGDSQTVTWKSSKTSVATVKNGKITAKKAGKATITATANGISKKVTVTVKNPTITVKKGSKKVTSVSVKKGKTATLTVSVSPKNSGISMTKLTAKQKKIASVTYKSGKITIKGKKKGSFNITVKSGKATKKIKVTVK